jgi:uncharacterized membrane protein
LYQCLQTPPPDDSSHRSTPSSSSKARPWFPVHSSSRGTEISYQSGGLPTFNNSISGHEDIQEDVQQNQWETSYGMRVDVLSAFAYILGPISGKLYSMSGYSVVSLFASALILLVLETHNDYVRFHGDLLRFLTGLFTTELIVNSLSICLANDTSVICAHICITAWSSFMDAVIPHYYIRTFRTFHGVSDP